MPNDAPRSAGILWRQSSPADIVLHPCSAGRLRRPLHPRLFYPVLHRDIVETVIGS
jgi:hypothetical protein